MATRILFVGIVCILTTSCASLQAPEFRGEESFKLGGIDGNAVDLKASAKMYNGNWFAIKIKPSDLDLFVEGDFIGTVHLNNKLKLKAKKESIVTADLTATLEKGAMLKSIRYLNKSELEIRVAGKVKGGIWIFSKKIKIDETRTINGKKLLGG